NPLPSVNATYLPLVCVQEDIPFTIVNPTPNTIYAWDFESNDTIDSIGPQYSSFIFDGFLSSGPFDVTVYGETAFGCVDSSTFTIRVADALNPNFNLTDNFGCDSLTFAAQPELQGVQNGTLSFQWRINDIIVDDGVGFPTALNYTLYAIPDSTITYDIELRLFSDTCATEARQIQTITLTPTPTIQVNQLPIDSCSQTSPLLPTFINTSVGSPDSFYIFWDNAIPNNGNSTNTQDVGTWDTLQPSPNENLYPAQDPIPYINNSNIPLIYLPEFEIFNQCGQDDTTIALTVLPNTVTAEVTAIDDTVCLGDTFEFVSGAFGFGTVVYSFGNNDTLESTEDTIRYTYGSAGTYVVIQT
ncbi:MAG: hypothetical protein VXW24_02590, partial [Bacteroidota bacterium]|nr:hypothetical protein [Bacteroidota bacterium]